MDLPTHSPQGKALIYGWIPKPGVSPRGCGKTGGMMWKLNQDKLKGRRIATNFTNKIRDEEMTANRLKKMGPELNKMSIGASEVHLFLESRRTQKGDQIKITYVVLQFRKRRINFHWDSQAPEQVERRLVMQTDVIIHCENLGCGDMDCRNQSCGIETCGLFHYEVYDGHTNDYLGDFWLIGPRDFYHLYDSEEVLMDFTTDEDDE